VPDDEEGAPSARPFWSGTLTFGLVSVPVDLYPAVRSRRASLRMLSGEGTPLARRFFNPESGKELDQDDLVRGYPLGGDRFVPLTDEELEGVAPEKSRDIDLRRFVPAEQLDPAWFRRGYYLTPGGGTTKAYRLLAATMEKIGKAGIATFVMRGTEYLVAILAEDGILRAETLRFPDELRTPRDVGLAKPKKPKPQDVKRISAAIERLARSKLDEKELEDVWSKELFALAARKKRKGEDLVDAPAGEAEEEDEDGKVIDLLEVLRRSMASAGAAAGGEGRKGPHRAARGKKGGGGALDKLTREELYERARKRDIPGRSSMTRAELIRALRGAA
jgi:DNA end-binding protein Ku